MTDHGKDLQKQAHYDLLATGRVYPCAAIHGTGDGWVAIEVRYSDGQFDSETHVVLPGSDLMDDLDTFVNRRLRGPGRQRPVTLTARSKSTPEWDGTP